MSARRLHREIELDLEAGPEDPKRKPGFPCHELRPNLGMKKVHNILEEVSDTSTVARKCLGCLTYSLPE